MDLVGLNRAAGGGRQGDAVARQAHVGERPEDLLGVALRFISCQLDLDRQSVV